MDRNKQLGYVQRLFWDNAVDSFLETLIFEMLRGIIYNICIMRVLFEELYPPEN